MERKAPFLSLGPFRLARVQGVGSHRLCDVEDSLAEASGCGARPTCVPFPALPRPSLASLTTSQPRPGSVRTVTGVNEAAHAEPRGGWHVAVLHLMTSNDWTSSLSALWLCVSAGSWDCLAGFPRKPRNCPREHVPGIR